MFFPRQRVKTFKRFSMRMNSSPQMSAFVYECREDVFCSLCRFPRTNGLPNFFNFIFEKMFSLESPNSLSLFFLFHVSFYSSEHLIMFSHKLFLDYFCFFKFPPWIPGIQWLYVASSVRIIHKWLPSSHMLPKSFSLPSFTFLLAYLSRCHIQTIQNLQYLS